MNQYQYIYSEDFSIYSFFGISLSVDNDQINDVYYEITLRKIQGEGTVVTDSFVSNIDENNIYQFDPENLESMFFSSEMIVLASKQLMYRNKGLTQLEMNAINSIMTNGVFPFRYWIDIDSRSSNLIFNIRRG